jgi:hypothetical protein
MRRSVAILDKAGGAIGAAKRLLGRASAIVVAMTTLAGFDVTTAAPATQTIQLITDPEQKLSVEVSGWLGLGKVADGCSEGLVPMRFTVVNGGDTEATITVRFAPGYGTIATVPRTRIVAAPGATVRSTVYVGLGQVGTSPGPAYFPSWMMSFGASGSGPRRDVECQIHQNWNSVATTTSSSPSPGGFHTPEPTETQRRLLTTAAGQRVLEAKHAYGTGTTQSEVDPAIAPEDWRGWTTLREFVLTDDDWTAMPTASRRAMLQWLALGGHVVLLADDTDRDRLDRIGLPASQADGRRRVGAGEVIALANGAIPRGVADDTPLGDALIERPVGWADSPWSGVGLGRQAGFLERGLPVAAILTFLALLAIIAGPVNIMLLAGRGRPARIFWTTPVISLVATSLLLGLMFLRDGVGGAGARRTLCLLDPDRNTMAILQEQFSRTGILLGASFPIREPSWMQPQPLTTTPYNAPTVTGSFVEIEDQRRSGDWFTSRSDQAFTLQTVRPGRGRIELSGPADAPEVISSLDVPLERVFVVDEEGRWWKTGRLGAGERRLLETSSAEEFAPFRRDISTLASQPIVRAIARLEGLPGYAWAEAAEPGKVAIASLDAIRWSQDEAWFVGPVVRTEGR